MKFEGTAWHSVHSVARVYGVRRKDARNASQDAT